MVEQKTDVVNEQPDALFALLASCPIPKPMTPAEVRARQEQDARAGELKREAS